MLRLRCVCVDPHCPVHPGGECLGDAETVVVRIDMDDQYGTPMCRDCADDALESGLFAESPELLRSHIPPSLRNQ